MYLFLSPLARVAMREAIITTATFLDADQIDYKSPSKLHTLTSLFPCMCSYKSNLVHLFLEQYCENIQSMFLVKSFSSSFFLKYSFGLYGTYIYI